MKIDACCIYSVQGFSKELGEQLPYEPNLSRRDICSQRKRNFSVTNRFEKHSWHRLPNHLLVSSCSPSTILFDLGRVVSNFGRD